MVKIERSFPAPESLEEEAKKVSGSYSKADVVERLKNDFHNKCYICEMDKLQDPQVEHLLPHMNGKYTERKFDWNNLFWVCGHCNGVKNQRIYDRGIVDCCKEDPEELIDFQLLNNNVQLEIRDNSSERTLLTVRLIKEVFNIENSGMRVYKSAMRLQELNQEMNKLYNSLEEYKVFPESPFVLRKIKVLLSRKSRFAAFKRSYIRNNKEVYPLLLEYIA